MLPTTFFPFIFPLLAIVIAAYSHHKKAIFPCPAGILSTPTYGTTNAVFTSCSTTYIHACVSDIYSILTNFTSYDLWNSFVINITPTSTPFPAVNATMTFTSARLSANTTQSSEVITILDAQDTVAAWKYDDRATPGLLKAEHVSKVTEVRDGWSSYVSWETYYGPLAVGLQAMLQGQLQDAFEAQGEDLRVWAETGRRRGG